MALVLNEEQQMLREAAKTFFSDKAPVSHLRKLRDAEVQDSFSRQLWSDMAEMGWPAIIIPEIYGGLGYSYTGLGLVLEESGRTLTPSPLISSALLGASALILSQNKAACEDCLPKVASGEQLLALAFEESAQHRPTHVRTTATRNGDQFVLQGCKQAVIDGHTADAFIISARTSSPAQSGQGISLFMVPSDTPGLAIKATELLDNHRVGSLQLDAVQIDKSQLLGELDQGLTLLDKVLDRGRIGIAAELLGIAQESFDRTVQYLKERKQFGVPIGVFQALQHRAAILFGEIELCKSVVLKALQALDDENSQTKEIAILASLAKAKCGSVAGLATAEGIQMHGGIGMTDEFDIGFFIKRWRSLNQQLGDDRFHTHRFAQLKSY